MDSFRNNLGFTLIEMLIVVAVIVILASIVLTVATRIESQAKEALAEGTIAIVTSALESFADYGYEYYDNPAYTAEEREFYLELDFPPDCNGFSVPELQAELGNVLGQTVSISGGVHDSSYSGCEAMYFFLARVPESRQVLEKLDSSLVTNADESGAPIEITTGQMTTYPLNRVVDPWGNALKYDYYEEYPPLPPPRTPAQVQRMGQTVKNFPVVTSAGPDGVFGTPDDISSRGLRLRSQ